MIYLDDGFSLSHYFDVQVQCSNYLTLNQEKPVNDLEFCENLETSEAAIEGGRTDLFINSPLLKQPITFQLTGNPPVPGGGAVSAILISILGNMVPFIKTSQLTLGLKFTQSQPNPFPLFR
jgi:hypothetical protein